MVLLASSLKGPQSLIALCFKFPGENDILYNETKIHCMVFWSLLYEQCVLHSVSFRTASLKLVDEAMNIGHFISLNLKDDADVYKQLNNRNMIGNVLIRKFVVALRR